MNKLYLRIASTRETSPKVMFMFVCLDNLGMLILKRVLSQYMIFWDPRPTPCLVYAYTMSTASLGSETMESHTNDNLTRTIVQIILQGRILLVAQISLLHPDRFGEIYPKIEPPIHEAKTKLSHKLKFTSLAPWHRAVGPRHRWLSFHVLSAVFRHPSAPSLSPYIPVIVLRCGQHAHLGVS
jgi:hypothetical protein